MSTADLGCTAELRNWVYSPDFKGLWGGVYGDRKERWPDGKVIRTSDVVNIYEHEFYFIFETKNSMYVCYKLEQEPNNKMYLDNLKKRRTERNDLG